MATTSKLHPLVLRLAVEREKLGLTQADVGRYTGSSRWTINRIEMGESLGKIGLVEKYAEFVGLELILQERADGRVQEER